MTVFATSTLYAQQGGTTRYIYDDTGRLVAVISPTGEANVYDYDASGNFIAIRRLTTDDLAVFAFSPQIGVPGDQITFVGVGFGSGVSLVTFNGAAANIIQVTATTIVAEVPQNAATGAVTITTPRGSVVTSKPFTVAGIRVDPSVVNGLLSGNTVQFSATVVLGTDASLTWSVDGTAGGAASVGSISDTGLYTAPNLPANQSTATFTIRAASVALPSVFGEAQVNVVNPLFVRAMQSAAVSVRFGGTQATTMGTGVAVLKASPVIQTLSAGVSISKGSPSIPVLSARVSVSRASPTVSALSAGVSVSKSSPSTPTLSAGVSIAKATPAVPVLSPSVAVSRGSTIAPVISPSVAVTNGPNITGITPGQLARGSSPSVTISGANFAGASSLLFIDSAGVPDSSISASGLSVSPDGTSITVTLTISSGSAVGRRIIIVTTPKAKSPAFDSGTNTFEVIP